MPTSPTVTNLENYFYSGQLRKYIIQFMSIFSGLQVKFGKNDFNSTSNLASVPVRYGNSDRVVDAILSDNTQNKAPRVPIISCYFTGLDIAPDMMKGVGVTERRPILPRGGALPDDVKVVYRYQPIPYKGRMEVTLFASNEDQHFQMLEQILMLFDPILLFQTSDDALDWTAINSVELTGINYESNVPKLEDRRIITTTLSFSFTCYLSPPVNLKTNFIKSVKLRMQAVAAADDVDEIVADINRPSPPYEKLFDIDDMDIPPN